MEISDIKLPVPIEFRRGSLRDEQEKSIRNGMKLMGWVEKHIPVKDARILDFGCGVKVAQALYQMDHPQKIYVGLDVYKKMISHMKSATRWNRKYKFKTVPFQNAMYNPRGQIMTPELSMPVGKMQFDIQLMFSVITHMKPADSAATFAMLRKCIAPGGKLFFWAFADADQEKDFFDHDPARPLLRAKYRQDFLEKLVTEAGWRIDLREDMSTKNHGKIRYVCSSI